MRNYPPGLTPQALDRALGSHQREYELTVTATITVTANSLEDAIEQAEWDWRKEADLAEIEEA